MCCGARLLSDPNWESGFMDDRDMPGDQGTGRLAYTPHGHCLLRHRRTEQTVAVPVKTYLRQCRGRFRNWQMAADSAWLRPPMTISEFIYGASDGDKQTAS